MKLRNMFRKFVQDEQGLETVEYAIIVGLIVVGTIAAIVAIGGWVSTQFTTLQNGITA